MSAATAPPPKKVNRIGLDVVGYRGTKTTLCAGCGHNSISERIVEVFFELGVEPWMVSKFSGIGCSSKDRKSTRLNSSHSRASRMPSSA